MSVAAALTIAGSDSGGGAGIQADLKSFAANRVYGASVLTAITAQNTLGVQAVLALPLDIIKAQIASVLSDIAIGAIKIGMVGTADIAKAVSEALSAFPARPLVLDPVMVAQSGGNLIDEDAVEALIRHLFPLASLITPNLPEAARLTGLPEARSEDDIVTQARRLLERGASAVLIKGGHAQGAEAIDYLVTADDVRRFSARRVPTANTHGTGCSLSSAIAAHLARGLCLNDAVGKAKTWLTDAIQHADELGVGHGAGPVHHFHQLWSHQHV